MVTQILVCEKCGFQIKVESKDKKSETVIIDYGEVSSINNKIIEFNCLVCGTPLKIAKKKPSRILSDSGRGNRERWEPAEMINANEDK
jgi:predicted RNA-binding Zn-ribbon protein involved in translation (DUF1610 family)